MTQQELNIQLLRLEKQETIYIQEALNIRKRIINLELKTRLSWQDSEKDVLEDVKEKASRENSETIAFPAEAFDSKKIGNAD